MDVLTIVRTVLRRWAIAVPVLLLTALGAFLLHSRTEPEYEASGTLLLADSRVAVTEEAGAPYDDLAADANLTGSVLMEILQGDEVRAGVRERDATATYSVDYDTAAALLRITASGSSEDSTLSVLEAVIFALEEEVDRRQSAAGVPSEARVEVDVLTPPTTAHPEPGSADDGADTRYRATSSLRLLNTPETAENPYAAAHQVTLRVLQEVALSPQSRSAVVAAGGVPSYTIEMERRDAAPVLYVTATGAEPEAVVFTYGEVMGLLERILEERQVAAGASPATWLTFESLSTPQVATRTSDSLSRPLVALVAIGVVFAVTLAVLVDGVLADRARRRYATADSRGKSDDPEAPAGPPHNGPPQPHLGEQYVEWREPVR